MTETDRNYTNDADSTETQTLWAVVNTDPSPYERWSPLPIVQRRESGSSGAASGFQPALAIFEEEDQARAEHARYEGEAPHLAVAKLTVEMTPESEVTDDGN